ncbi:MAG: VWA domain-containing protein, partial [Acidobacteriota bacterium]
MQHPRPFPILSALLLAAGALAVSAQPAAESTARPAAEDFFDVVDVEIANIDVWVTDKKGNAIEGLGKDDFLVFRDGKPTEVTNFYAVAGGRPVTNDAEDEQSASGPREPSLDLGETAARVAEEHRLWMIIYIDNFNIQALERNRIFPSLRHFIGRALRPGDQAMVVTYDRSLEVRQPFTDDIELLRIALDEIIDDSGFAASRRRDLVSALERIDKSDDARQALLYARSYAEERMNGVGYTADALQRLIESLGGLSGRKALVHVSSGVPMAAGEEAFHAVAEKFNVSEPYSEIPRHDNTRSFERINRHANAHRVAFYTVDAGGMRGLEFGNAEYAGFVDPDIRRTLDSIVPENLQAPLRLMAIETGGRAIVNTNEILPALEKASQDFESFYSLGIASDSAEEGRYHKIEVKLKGGRKDLRLRHRAGYRSKTTDTRVRESLRSALLYSQQANADDIRVSWGRAE